MSLAWLAVVQLLVFIYSGILWNSPWVLVFVCYSDWFDFCIFALMRWLSWGPLCEPNFCVCVLTFIRENTQYLACNEKSAFFTSDVYNNQNLRSCQKVCDALVYLLDNIFRFGTKLYRQTIGIPMGTNCAPLVADLFLFCC